jgi:DNA adenine methylase
LSVIMSPLRYPGSKQKVISKIRPFWEKIANSTFEYREPFMGGASIFLNLELNGIKVWLNDKDVNIATLFTVIRDYPDALCNMVKETEPTIELWDNIRYAEPKEQLQIAFRSLFLNRTNYSGILGAYPIGGYRQKSQYTINCRWNKEDLIKRIKQCSAKLKDIVITSEDFFHVIIRQSNNNVFLMLDPPYYIKGNQLYDEIMTIEDHIRLRDLLSNTKFKFLLTYDNCDEVINLYRDIPGLFFYRTGWYYSSSTVSNNKRTHGNELFISNIEIRDYPE